MRPFGPHSGDWETIFEPGLSPSVFSRHDGLLSHGPEALSSSMYALVGTLHHTIGRDGVDKDASMDDY